MDLMQDLRRTCYCGEVTKAGETVVVGGFVQKVRNLGNLIFIDLRDRTGIVQLAFNDQTDRAIFEKAASCHSEYVLMAKGVVAERSSVNKEMKTGAVEILVEDLRVLSKAQTPPFAITDETKTNEELRLKYRYLDLRRAPLQHNLIMRHKIALAAREYFYANNFIEIETPMMMKSTPEGARDYLIPSRVHNGKFYALPQSPQIYKQLLMVSGMDRYIQIARCFRDEDLRADRQPEFTQADMELSFVDIDDVIEVNERLLKHLFKEVINVDVEIPFKRMPWQEAMDRFGSDKPDTRFGMELCDVSDVVKGCGFGVFTGALENGGSVRGINVEGQAKMPRKKIDKLVEHAKGCGAKGLAYLAIHEDGTYKCSFSKFMKPEELDALVKAMDGQPGDLLFFAADKNKVVFDVLGNLRLEIARQLDLLKKDDFKFLWVTEFPLLEYSEEEGRYVAMHHPFTMPRHEDLDKLESDPGSVKAIAYDMVLNGVEIGGGSLRIYQSDVQEKVFKAIGLPEEEAKSKFGFMLDAFQYGAPPHAGCAFGLDRLVMLMAKRQSIRDVIAFPKTQSASDVMSQAPSEVEPKQLKELHIKPDIEEEEEQSLV